MSHIQQLNYVSNLKEKFKNNFENCSVLEIGSLNINGTIRIFFNNCQYVGVDVGPGKDVDVVCEGQNYNAPYNSYDTVISCECFEHNPFWIETFNNMINLCKDNGLIIFTCATTGRPEHGTSRTKPKDSPLTIKKGWDYYKNLTENDFRLNFKFDDVFKDYEFSCDMEAYDLYFWGIKK